MDENAAPGARSDCGGLYLLLVSRADGAPRAPSTVKLSRASQPEPVLRGRWRKRLYFRNIWTTRESADSYSRRQCIKKR